MGAAESKPSRSIVTPNLADRFKHLDIDNGAQQHDLEKEPSFLEREKRHVGAAMYSARRNAAAGVPPALSRSPASMTLSISAAEKWEEELLEDPKNQLAMTALGNGSLNSVVYRNNAVQTDRQLFNVKIPVEGSPVTNQRASGRCWIFAATNVFRVAIMKKHNLSDFQLSQAYIFFWDKLEKANWFLEQIMETKDEPLDGRLLQSLLASPVSDGGQWDMLANLVSKYGLVPHSVYPDALAAQSSSYMDGIITAKLREDALILRSISSMDPHALKSSLPILKANMLKEVHRILTIMLGPPPSPEKSFTWEYPDASSKFHSMSYTPLQFAKELSSPSLVRSLGGVDVNKVFSLVNDPRNPYLSLLYVSRLGNVVGGHPTTYVNVDMTTLKQTAIKMLKAGMPVFFGSDVGKSSNSLSGIMDIKMYNYGLAFDISLNMDKTQRLITGSSSITHAMVLTAVHLNEDGSAVRWRVQNSWGAVAGTDGYFVMTDEWMDEFVYQVVVDPSFVAKEVQEVLNKDPIVLPLWDPMGALA